jgi:hypothetical protein
MKLKNTLLASALLSATAFSVNAATELTPEQKVYFEYTCRGGDYIKTCTVPSPHLNGDDLEREKKMLKL